MKSQKHNKKILYAGVLLVATLMMIPAISAEGDRNQSIVRATEIRCIPEFDGKIIVNVQVSITYYYDGLNHEQDLTTVFQGAIGNMVVTTIRHDHREWGGSGMPIIVIWDYPGPWNSCHVSITENLDNFPPLYLNYGFPYPLVPPQRMNSDPVLG